MGLCIGMEMCGNCDVCCNPCLMLLGACCLVPCLCPNACGQRQPQAVHVHHPPVIIEQPPPPPGFGYPPPPNGGYPSYPGYPQPPQYGYPPPQGYPGYPQYR